MTNEAQALQRLQVGVGLDVGEIVDRNDFDVVRVASKQGTQGQTIDATKTVNS